MAERDGMPKSEWGEYEFDHLIPLSIGGNNSVANLWLQHRGKADSGGKDKLERRLYNQLKAGTINQAEAIKQIYLWFDSR